MIVRCWLKWQTLRMYKVRESDIRVDTDGDDVTTATDLTKLSRSWCEHDTFALESVYYIIIFRAFPVVVLELCDRYFGLGAACLYPVIENNTPRSTCTSRSDSTK